MALIAAAYTLGTVIAMGVTGPIHDLVGWRVAFYLFGALVVPLAIFWFIFFVNKPHESGFCCRIDAHELSKIIKFRANAGTNHKNGSQTEESSDEPNLKENEKMEDNIMDLSKHSREKKEKVPWLDIFRNPSYLSLIVAYFACTLSPHFFPFSTVNHMNFNLI